MRILSLFTGGCLSGADGPNRFIGDDETGKVIRNKIF
jgi:hypothetical protein